LTGRPKAAKAAAKTGYWTIEIVERSSTAVGFEVLPKRWIVTPPLVDHQYST
jgi:hypothetical protein